VILMCVRDDDALQGGIWLHQPRDPLLRGREEV